MIFNRHCVENVLNHLFISYSKQILHKVIVKGKFREFGHYVILLFLRFGGFLQNASKFESRITLVLKNLLLFLIFLFLLVFLMILLIYIADSISTILWIILAIIESPRSVIGTTQHTMIRRSIGRNFKVQLIGCCRYSHQIDIEFFKKTLLLHLGIIFSIIDLYE